MNRLDLLAELCALPGISGHEDAVADRIESHLRELGIESRRDRIGNLIGHVPGHGPRVVYFVHMDEVGLVVRKIHANGFLYVERVGGASASVLPGLRIHVWGTHGPVAGVVGAWPQHLGTNQPAALEAITLDVGARSKTEAIGLGIEVGSPITYVGSQDLMGQRISAKSLDDRLGCELLLELGERLVGRDLPVDLYLAFIVQEETILRGAVPVIYDLEPDWVVGLDGTLAFDTPDLEDGQTEIALGSGAVIKVMDHLRGQGLGFISHLGLRRHLEQVAVEAKIPFQREIVIGLSTAATPLPYLRAGLPVVALSFPLRYTHSPVEVADLGDAQACLDLLEQLTYHPWVA